MFVNMLFYLSGHMYQFLSGEYFPILKGNKVHILKFFSRFATKLCYKIS